MNTPQPTSSVDTLAVPSRIQVKSIVASRYPDFPHGGRPLSWDERVSGLDIITTEDGKTVTLRSDGQQSTPQAGWVLMITGGGAADGYLWTLYGMPKAS
jgi:hypothetical protein